MQIQFTYFPLSTFPVIHTEKKTTGKHSWKNSVLCKKKKGRAGIGEAKARRYRKDYGLIVISPGILPVRLGK